MVLSGTKRELHDPLVFKVGRDKETRLAACAQGTAICSFLDVDLQAMKELASTTILRVLCLRLSSPCKLARVYVRYPICALNCSSYSLLGCEAHLACTVYDVGNGRS